MDNLDLRTGLSQPRLAAHPAAPASLVRLRDLLAIALERLRGAGGRPLPVSTNLLAHLRFVVSLAQVRFRWQRTTGSACQRRVYKDYDTYLRHQAGKLPRLNLTEYDRTYREALRERLRGLPRGWHGTRTLCLGARIGTEVKAFLDLGAFAVGVDLNPGPGNRYVVHGDFHHLQYADASVDVVFSNSLDHVFDVPRWMAEVRRVLRPEGMLLLEAGRGVDDGDRPEFYEALCWSSIEQLVAEVERHGFRLITERPFTEPSRGSLLLLARTPSGALPQTVEQAGPH